MFLSSMHQSRSLMLKDTVTNLFKVRSLKILNTQYQDSLPGSKVEAEPLPGAGKNIEGVTAIDRPQTDNLLLSPDKIPKTKDEKAAGTNVSENKNMYKELEQKLKNISENQIIAEEKSCSSAVWAPNKPKVELQVAKKTEHAVSFEEVPGPTSLKVVSNMMKNIPVIGNQKVWTRNIKPFDLLFNKYGDIVCLRIPLCGEIVLVQKPEHISAIYKQRNLNNVTSSSFDSLTEWHKRQAKRHFDVKLLIGDTLNRHTEYLLNFKDYFFEENFLVIFESLGLSLPQEIKDIFKENYEAKKIFWSNAKYHHTVEKTSDEFIKRIFAIRNIHDEVPNDFHNELYTWGIECMMQTLFGTNLGFYSVGDLQTNLEAQRTLKSFIDASDALQQCESGMQLWRVFNTRSWEKLTNSCETLENILAKHIRMSKLRLDIALKMMMENKDVKETSEIIKSSLVKALILSGCVQPEQILTLCMDMMIIGVNAVSISLGFIFYHLAKCPKKQQQLFSEICKVLPRKNSVLKLEDLDKTPYLHACVTESLRLKHPIPYSVIQLSSSIILNKYFIPAGTFVMTANEISCMKEENFDEALRFKPERWLDDSAASLQDVVIPLSEGTRSFLGRDWLHQQLAIATAKVVRNFNLGYNYGEIKTNRKIISKPNKPFKFTFEERTI